MYCLVSRFLRLALSLSLLATALSFSAPNSVQAATIYNNVDLDVPTIGQGSYWERRYWTYRAPRGALNVNLLDPRFTDVSLWQTRAVTPFYTDVKLYVKAGPNRTVSFQDWRARALTEGSAHNGQRGSSNLMLALSGRIINERCNGSVCTPARTFFNGGIWRSLAHGGEAFSGYLGVSAGNRFNWRAPRQHGWLQIDVTEDLQFSVQASGYETQLNTVSIVGAGRPAEPPAVPLPAAGWALLAALGGLPLLRRRAA